jgi:D-alanine-D-alanine ligase-like ATP-grasp enzyme
MQIMDFVHNKSTGVGYPIIVKPDNGVGSINTFKLNDDCEVQHFFSNCFVEVRFIFPNQKVLSGTALKQ